MYAMEMREDSSIPLYQQVKNIIKGQIVNGILIPGAKIPTETELCAIYSVSRITVRQAINSLVQEKLLIRKQGKGTFVTPLKIRLPRLYSFSEDMKELGLNPSSRVLEKEVIEADEEVATILRLPPANQKINKIVRVRLANNEPVLIERTFVPFHLCPDLLERDMEKGSLYHILRADYGFLLDHAVETYEVTLITKTQAKILKCKGLHPAFAIERVAFLKTGVPYELTRSIGRGDRLRFSSQLFAEQSNFQRHIKF